METKGTTMRQVALMNYSMEEEKQMSELDVVWIQTMDLKHENVVAYLLDIQVEHIDDVCQRKYVDMDDFYSYTDEYGSKWWISNAMSVQDMDAFFQCYFHMNENEDEAA